ncbi:hypothetical protein Memar_2267 [Methanoculleus marisnigri JR1]|uniref:Uncharacterized protein n=2 Tax=Methanoculleus TaxID=45989 RepID=A3CXU0_METMJ|nr:hypothetical protein Memar_2267 [Methanoculleus marisnigri JR1]
MHRTSSRGTSCPPPDDRCRTGVLERTLQILMVIGGIQSLAGLIGAALAGMGIRNIGILGYVGVSLIVFPLLAIVFGQAPEGAG